MWSMGSMEMEEKGIACVTQTRFSVDESKIRVIEIIENKENIEKFWTLFKST